MDNPDFEPDVVKKASKAAYGLVSWVRAMEAYDRYISLQALLAIKFQSLMHDIALQPAGPNAATLVASYCSLDDA